MSTNAFTPMGNTVTFTANVSGSVPTPVQALSTTLGGNQYRILNAGSNTVFLGIGNTSANATANAVVISSTGQSYPLLPGTDEILTFAPNWYFTGITSSGTSQIYITPGDGL
jgi:hypothetical protein